MYCRTNVRLDRSIGLNRPFGYRPVADRKALPLSWAGLPEQVRIAGG
jgi:hypothetical protein